MKTLMITILLIFILFIKNGFSQGSVTTQNQRDSLTNQLKAHSSDTSRVMILYQLCRAYSLINPAKAIQLGEEGLNLARKIDFQIGELFCLEATSFVYSLTGSWEKGFKATYDALALAKKIATGREAISVNTMHLLYDKLGDEKEAFAWMKKTYQLSLSWIQV